MSAERPVVLLVDDDALAREATRAALAGWYELVAIPDARGLGEALEAWRPEALILDLSLPDGPDGESACRRVRADERWRTLPVVIVSGRPELEALEIGVRAGADAWVGKPADAATLRRELERLIGLSRGRSPDEPGQNFAA